jgi:non-canonical (house-cleaning) NTP pyrophosphatase
MAIKIVVGSTSEHKLAAVRQACAQIGLVADVVGVKTNSLQDEQPIGTKSTYLGARTRASAVLSVYPDCICIGIESGIVHTGNKFGHFMDMAYVVIAQLDGDYIVTTTPSIEFPSEFYYEAGRRGFKTTTVGSVIAEKLGGDSTDPHATLTKGRVTRVSTLVAGLVPALQQLGFQP